MNLPAVHPAGRCFVEKMFDSAQRIIRKHDVNAMRETTVDFHQLLVVSSATIGDFKILTPSAIGSNALLTFKNVLWFK